ncbi:Fc.00g068540.m01.CDS01 [Cosmosporella sp. VM-42]
MGRILKPPNFKESSVYQVYPASFQDSTGSGAGDLKGVISRVDYFKDLGVDIVWLSPIFESPQIDMGYDISDYKTIDPKYGHISDVDVLKDKLHERNIKLVLDLVMNHTSDQHEWFKESRKSKDNPFRDWYIWKPPKYDLEGNRQPPNNWKSVFEGSAWEYDETTDEYYLHIFCTEQPDLNWENPAVRDAVHGVMRFWLDRGIDGFRMDVINFVSKDQAFPDSEATVLPGHEYYACGPRCHEFLKEMGDILKEYDAFSVGEMPLVHKEEELIKAVAADRGELNMIFHFELMDIDHGPQGKYSQGAWSLKDLKRTVNKWQKFMIDNQGWNALYLENHDQPRSVSRFMYDDPQYRVASAKLLAIFLGFQSGTVFIYQGQEIGMTNMPHEWPIEDYLDVELINHWNQHKDTADAATIKTLKEEYRKKGRDNARTPMQWDTTPNAGFTVGTPWMRVNDNYWEINAAAQVDDPDSVWSCWRKVLRTRKFGKPIFVYGDFTIYDAGDDRVFAYMRTEPATGWRVLVVCNFSTEAAECKMGDLKVYDVYVSTTGKTAEDLERLTDGVIPLDPCEALAIRLV